MNLVIDVGNTLVKVALFKDGSLFLKDSFLKKELSNYIKKITKEHIVLKAIISSVATISENQLDSIKHFCPLIVLTSNTKVAFKNDYGTPETLGVDRLALVAAAYKLYPKQNVLTIDAGTCITYDLLTEGGYYKGGAISPGVQMRFNALHTFTDKLPKLIKQDQIELIGGSTVDSMQSGVINGVIAEINGIIAAYNLKYQKLTVVLTGGDTYFLANRLKNGIFANPNFLLEGLNSILIHNCKND